MENFRLQASAPVPGAPKKSPAEKPGQTLGDNTNQTTNGDDSKGMNHQSPFVLHQTERLIQSSTFAKIFILQ